VFKSTILPSDDPNLVVPDALRRGVERANQLLEVELLPTDAFDIAANWRFRTAQSGDREVLLDLFTITEGETYGLYGHPLKADVFADDSHIRRCLNMPVWYLNRTLAYRIKLETNEQQGRLKQILQTAEAE